MNKNENNGSNGMALQRLKTPESVATLVFIPALVLAAAYESASISELVMVYRQSGLGGERSCRKLIHRLERLKLLQIDSGSRDDRREKSVRLTPSHAPCCCRSTSTWAPWDSPRRGRSKDWLRGRRPSNPGPASARAPRCARKVR